MNEHHFIGDMNEPACEDCEELQARLTKMTEQRDEVRRQRDMAWREISAYAFHAFGTASKATQDEIMAVFRDLTGK